MKRKAVLRSLGACLLMIFATPSFAVFKCEQHGNISYSDRACPGGVALDLAPIPAADATEANRQARDTQRSLERLEKARRQREAKEEKERQRAAKLAGARQKKCATLARRQKWADEDAASATGKAAESARRKAQRKAEEYQDECGRTNALGMVH